MAANPEESMEHPIRLIKKYPNRRLYDTKTSSYITLADVKQMVLKQRGVPGGRRQDRRGPDAQILLQIILEEEAGGVPMFSSDMLSQIIRFYGNAMQGMMGSYLEKNLQPSSEMQKALQEQSQKLYGDNSKSSHGDLGAVHEHAGPGDAGPDGPTSSRARRCSCRCRSRCRTRRATCSPASSFPRLPARAEPSSERRQEVRRRCQAGAPRRLPKVGFVSLGCPKALVDSERILTQLRAEGYAIAPDYDGADLVVVNTCGFIDAAVEESLDAIGEALAENGKVIVTGCLGAKGDVVKQDASRGARGHRPARDRRSDERGARAPAEAARSVHRPGAAAGHQAHAEALRLSEDLRRLQPPLHVLHHSLDARRPRVAARSAK